MKKIRNKPSHKTLSQNKMSNNNTIATEKNIKYILNKKKELIKDRNKLIKSTVIDEDLEFETAEVLFSPENID